MLEAAAEHLVIEPQYLNDTITAITGLIAAGLL